MFPFEEAALSVLREDPQASIAADVEAALWATPVDALVAPLLAAARLRVFIEDQGYTAAAASLAGIIRSQRQRLPQAQASSSARRGQPWQPFADRREPPLTTLASLRWRPSNGATQPDQVTDAAVVHSPRGGQDDSSQ